MKIDQIKYPSLTGSFRVLINFLNESPSDEVFTTNELAGMLETTSTTLYKAISRNKSIFDKYQYMPPNRGKGRWWGHPEAIKALKRKFRI